jgi:hypothetical protein
MQKKGNSARTLLALKIVTEVTIYQIPDKTGEFDASTLAWMPFCTPLEAILFAGFFGIFGGGRLIPEQGVLKTDADKPN